MRTEMLWTIKKALEEAGIEIPYPQRVVTIAPGARIEVSHAHGGGDIR